MKELAKHLVGVSGEFRGCGVSTKGQGVKRTHELAFELHVHPSLLPCVFLLPSVEGLK